MSTPITLKSTVDVNVIQSMGGDSLIVAAAKVSTNGTDAVSFAMTSDGPGGPFGVAKNSKGEPWTEKDSFGLINYLVMHRHGTPFEHSAITFFVHAPIFVWREWHRHRIGFSYNEESGRYKQLDPIFYVPDRDRPMMCVPGWKPGRPKFTRCEDDSVFQTLFGNLTCSYQLAYRMYQENLNLGVDPGLARDCLPVGIYSGCWVTCNPRSLMAFISLRTHEPEAKQVSYPLWEIDVAARACEQALEVGWPITYAAFVANGRVAP